MSIFERNKKSESTFPPTAAGKPEPAPPRPGPAPPRPAETQTIIGPRVLIKGDINAEESIRIEGTIEGRVTSKDIVYIGAHGQVQADVEAREIHVMGTVRGNLKAQERIHLRGNARVEGDVSTRKLAVDENAFIMGRINMTEPEPPKPAPKTRPKKPPEETPAP